MGAVSTEEPRTAAPDAEQPAPAGAPRRLQRLSGTLAAASVVVVALLFAVGQRAPVVPQAAAPDPTPAQTVTPPTIPDEARTQIFRSTTAPSNEFRASTLALEPTLTGRTTNTYAVRVETSAAVDADAAARFIQQVLDDPRGWAGFGNNNFQLVADVEVAGLTFTIASPATTDQLCGARAKTQGLFSCRTRDAIVINSDRWHYMVPNFNNLDEYRAYVINHYTGEFLGQRLAFCQTVGAPAPAMAQQDVDLDGCLPNAWPKLS